jgi:Domain of unknown function (DUF4180)
MNVAVHETNKIQVAEMQSQGIIMRSARDAADVIRQLLERRIKKLILYERNLCPEFWQSPYGLAKEILQKFADNAVAVAFVGDFSRNNGKSFGAFMDECNKGNQIVFSENVELARIGLCG